MSTGKQVGDPLTGHTDGVTAVATSPVGGRPTLVTGGSDKAVRVWISARGRGRPGRSPVIPTPSAWLPWWRSMVGRWS
ncbi:hypothetical protein [Nonomuraea sp. NPDC050643]|uniref:hypothetical protein n=1 Tax=Nonomuraea sp. NPDC050643 TaxID=3155660 RepID=UPI0033F88C0B